MKIPLPDHVKHIISTLEAAGYAAYAVGGCIRDTIRNIAPKDWDIATSATPAQAKELFARTVDTGIKHGTITVLLDSLPYEVTTFRIDGEYLDSRRPQSVEFTASIVEDLSRRDFTMNAIAYSPAAGIVDPFDGQKDIEQKLIRCVGSPLLRFGEDALRMLRAIRFSATTGFCVDSEIIAAISALKSNLQNISPERIREELSKLITSPNPQAMNLLHETGLLPYVLHGREYDGDLAQVITWIEVCPPTETMRVALFLHRADNDIENILRDLRYDNKSAKEISLYVKMLPTPIPHDRVQIKKLLRYIPQELLENLLTLQSIICSMPPSSASQIGWYENLLRKCFILTNSNAQTISVPQAASANEVETLTPAAFENIRQEIADIIKSEECFTLPQLAIKGSDLAEIGILPGKEMGDMLEFLLDEVIHSPLSNTREILISIAVRKNGHKFPQIFNW